MTEERINTSSAKLLEQLFYKLINQVNEPSDGFAQVNTTFIFKRA